MASSQAPGIVKRGILIKQGHLVKNWKRRLFVLDAEAKSLQYYTCVGGEQLKGTFLLSGGWVQHVDEAAAGKPNCIEVVGNARRLLLSACDFLAVLDDGRIPPFWQSVPTRQF